MRKERVGTAIQLGYCHNVVPGAGDVNDGVVNRRTASRYGQCTHAAF